MDHHRSRRCSRHGSVTDVGIGVGSAAPADAGIDLEWIIIAAVDAVRDGSVSDVGIGDPWRCRTEQTPGLMLVSVVLAFPSMAVICAIRNHCRSLMLMQLPPRSCRRLSVFCRRPPPLPCCRQIGLAAIDQHELSVDGSVAVDAVPAIQRVRVDTGASSRAVHHVKRIADVDRTVQNCSRRTGQ